MEQPEPEDGDQHRSGSAGTDPAAYGESFADVYDDWYGELSTEAELTDMVRCLMALAQPHEHPVILELGAGTGRLALPLAEAGTTVVALDGSAVMLQQMNTKTHSGPPAPLALGANMALLPLQAASVDGAFVAYNTFFNLDTEAEQQQCLHEVARVLSPGGFLAIEAFTPVTDHDNVSPSLTRSPVSTYDRAVFVASRVDASAQLINGAHLDLSPQGLRLRPWRIRYLTPDQLDRMAIAAGLTLGHRWNSWEQTPFDGTAGHHVSVYRHTGV